MCLEGEGEFLFLGVCGDLVQLVCRARVGALCPAGHGPIIPVVCVFCEGKL